MVFSGLTPESKPRVRRLTILSVIFAIISALFLLNNTLLYPVIQKILVKQRVVLTNNTDTFVQWLAPTPVIYKIVTAYNLTNPDVVEAGGRPVVEPMGPYYYREYRERVNVVEVYDEELWYNEKKWYEFDSNKTNADRDIPLNPFTDNFTTLNLGYIGVAYNLTATEGDKIHIDEILAIIAAQFEGDMSIIMTRPVNEVIFGYTDKFLEIVSLARPGVPSQVQVVYNMSDRDVSTVSKIKNGRKDVTQLAEYTQWQGYTSLPYWSSPEANTLNGTEGLFFQPFIEQGQELTTFVDDLFRANPMEWVGREEVLTIPAYKYQIPDYVMRNASNNPLNAGFYAFGPDGLMNLTSCVMAPVFASKPSFLDAEDWLLEDVEGLPPANKSTMDTNIWVNPLTGVLVKARKQLQVNLMLTQNVVFPGFAALREDRPRFVPIAQVIEGGGMDQGLVDQFHAKVFRPMGIMVVLMWSLFAIFNVTCFGLTFHCLIVAGANRRCPDRDPILPADDDDEILGRGGGKGAEAWKEEHKYEVPIAGGELSTEGGENAYQSI